MADSRAMPGFGQVDLDIEDEPGVPARSPSSSPAFGQVDFDLGEPDDPAPPPSTSRVFNVEKNRPTRRNMPSVHDESTRIVKGDALALASRPPSPLDEDGNTRAWAEVDEALLSVGELDADPFDARGGSPSSRTGNPPSASSGSGVATRDDRVAAMRDLYARGDAAGALALASTLDQGVVFPQGADHPDASIAVEFGEASLEVDDPFGGLIPLDEEDDEEDHEPRHASAAPTFAPPAHAASRPPLPRLAPALLPTAPPSAPHLTLTERHSIPRVLKSLAEVSKLKIDHRAGFLLAHVDGMQTLEEILDICAMPAAEALGLISNLREMGVIEFD